MHKPAWVFDGRNVLDMVKLRRRGLLRIQHWKAGINLKRESIGSPRPFIPAWACDTTRLCRLRGRYLRIQRRMLSVAPDLGIRESCRVSRQRVEAFRSPACLTWPRARKTLSFLMVSLASRSVAFLGKILSVALPFGQAQAVRGRGEHDLPGHSAIGRGRFRLAIPVGGRPS